MCRSGRANWIVVALTAASLAIVGLVALGEEAPETAANRFLIALARGDVPTLAAMSYFNPPRDPAEVQRSWRRTVEYGKYYRFTWRIRSSTSPGPGRATVRTDFVRDALAPNAYEENFSLDLVKVGGDWKVDVGAVNRAMYPALPR